MQIKSLRIAASFAVICVFAAPLKVAAAPATMDLSKPPPVNHSRIVMGSATNPAGAELTVDGASLRENDRPWVPVMGEFHFSRYPQDEWRQELLKMKAGGVDIVATYVFWIHHEETEGQWDWSGQRDLRKFIQLCGELGLRNIVRCGPWDHGEVRNGGFPDWVLDKGYKLRSNDPGYLALVQKVYQQIATQLRGLLWKDGGPVFGIQLENEYWGDPQHLLELKQLAVDAGLDVPIYTRTGWPELPKPLPFGEIIPLYGGYAEGFWDRKLETMPDKYWTEFAFKYERTNTAIANDHLGSRPAQDEARTQDYPYLTCELGAGMASSYHRRMNIFPMDGLAVAMVRLGSGSNSPGYYMYHGGTNPDSKTGITLQEAQTTRHTNYNDLPVKSYDFQTALGEFGQVRPQYHLLRRLHMFLHDFGQSLPDMPAFISEERPKDKHDTQTLRWSVRTDGRRGFLFVNNYQRLQPMPAKSGVQFKIKLADSELTIPHGPVSIPADSTFLWPFNFDLGGGARLIYATAQPVCSVDDGDTRITVFATTGVDPEFAFDAKSVDIESTSGTRVIRDGATIFGEMRPGTGAAITLRGAEGKQHKIVLLDEQTSLACWKSSWHGQDRIFLSSANLVVDGDALLLASTESPQMSVSILPAPGSVRFGDRELDSQADGLFRKFTASVPNAAPMVANLDRIEPPGEPRKVPIGRQKVAQAPDDGDFEQAGIWQVILPESLNLDRRLILRASYAGDVARAYAGDKLLTDNFYNGTPFDIGVNRFQSLIRERGLTLKVLPLRKDAPIYMLKQSWPQFGEGDVSIAGVRGVEVIEEHRIELRAGS